MSKNTVILNGTEYDAHSGLAIRQIASPKSQVPTTSLPTTHATMLHSHTQKSQTLNRSVVKRTIIPVTVQTKQPTATKSPHITKFAPHPVDAAPAATQRGRTMDIGPVQHHPVAIRAHAAMAARQQPAAPVAAKPSSVLKQEAIKDAFERAESRASQEKSYLKQEKKKKSHKFSLATSGLALMLLAGYFTYLNMPSLSVRVAASQAGINASYPAYKPDGYSLSGPVAYADGEVDMKFAANTGSSSFIVKQSESSWDSSAVLDNYVKAKAGDNYVTYNERGLTIYTYGGNAAWVNGGILYTINGDAPLSSDQIRHLATSM